MLNEYDLTKSYDEEEEKIRIWLRDKNYPFWRRCLFLLYKHGGLMMTNDIAAITNGNTSAIWRILRKMELTGSIKSYKDNKKLLWMISDYGKSEIFRNQENGYIPLFEEIK